MTFFTCFPNRVNQRGKFRSQKCQFRKHWVAIEWLVINWTLTEPYSVPWTQFITYWHQIPHRGNQEGKFRSWECYFRKHWDCH